MKEPKPKYCLNCKDQFIPFKTTDKYCCSQCYFVSVGQKEIDNKVKAYKKNLGEDSAFGKLQRKINKIVRLIDRGHACISTGQPFGHYAVDAGHYFSVGSNHSLRFNLLNIFGQCRSDNHFKGGKGSTYSLRLKEVFGSDVRDEIEGLVSKYKVLKLSKIEAKEACLKANQIIKALESMDRMFTTKERISIRREFNQTLGIYK